jgi:hypothetical protein
LTGSDRVGHGGLSKIALTIHRTPHIHLAPEAHTCSMAFMLPDYQDERLMRRMLDVCLKFHEGFGRRFV